MSIFQICLCGAFPGGLHDGLCPRPLFNARPGSDLERAWLEERAKLHADLAEIEAKKITGREPTAEERAATLAWCRERYGLVSHTPSAFLAKPTPEVRAAAVPLTPIQQEGRT